jgi:DNA-binding NtrC family response regulator
MDKILIVDDNKDLRFTLRAILEGEGYEVIDVEDGDKAIREVKKDPPDLVLLDLKLPGKDGLVILEEIKKLNSSISAIMLTGHAEVKSAVNAMKMGAHDYISKPFDNEEMILVIKRALDTRHLTKEVQFLRQKLDEKNVTEKTLGNSPSVKHIIKQVEVVAPTDMTVVIEGESGTGKEVFANLVHKKSLRKDKPFIAIDCGAIPETLIESELFGYEKGAFTGADAQKEGKFEQANGGTLFLDEITNLSDGNQVKLLRVIQEKKLTRLGGKKITEVNVRIISATNKKLVDAVKEGKFRSDLYYRINEFQINLPPLRERKEDIPMLANYFVSEANQEMNKNIKSISSDVMKILLNHHWTGNIRELRNLMRRAVLLTEGSTVTEVDLLADPSLNTNDNSSVSSMSLEETSIDEVTKNVEKEMIIKALKQTNGNKVKAANLLKINRKALYRKMKTLGL